MDEFGINLIGDRIPPLEKRRQIFRNIILYLGLCGAALIILICLGVRDLIFTAWHRADLHTMEREFRQSHPNHRDILTYAVEVESRGEQLVNMLEVVERSVEARYDLAQMIAGITAGLPEEHRLIEFLLDSEKGLATFDVAAPIVSASGDLIDPGELVGLWNRDAGLASVFEKIESVETHRRLVGGTPAFVLRFLGKLPSRGA